MLISVSVVNQGAMASGGENVRRREKKEKKIRDTLCGKTSVDGITATKKHKRMA